MRLHLNPLLAFIKKKTALQCFQRLAVRYGAVLKFSGTMVAFLPQKSTTSASGADLPTFSLSPPMVKQYRLQLPQRTKVEHVKAFWYDREEAKKVSVSAGSASKPAKIIKTEFANEDEAKAAAASQLGSWNKQAYQLNLTCIGFPELLVKAPLELMNVAESQVCFPEALIRPYHIDKVTHTLNGSGYETQIEATAI